MKKYLVLLAIALRRLFMRSVNIRAFKVVFQDGSTSFESQNNYYQGSNSCASVQSLADDVKNEVASFLRDNRKVSIDLRPYHGLECVDGLSPRRCLSLDDGEASEFWGQFNA